MGRTGWRPWRPGLGVVGCVFRAKNKVSRPLAGSAGWSRMGKSKAAAEEDLRLKH